MKRPVFALVDCNNFFVSCERVFRPDLWGKPVAVLSNNDGCIVARSNEVKELGIPMGIPVFKVRDELKRHNVTLFSGNFPLYGDFSQRVVQILNGVCPDIEVYSVDESFLELSSLPIANYAEWARELSRKVFAWTGIPVSVGVAPTKTLAKAAADFAKKHPASQGGHAIVGDTEAHQQLLHWLKVEDVWGIGRRSAPKLRARGVTTAYDLSRVSEQWVLGNLTIRGLKLVRELRGESCLGLEDIQELQHSIARTRSFGHNVRDYYELESAIATFAAQAGAKLREKKKLAGAVLTFLRASKDAGLYGGTSQLIQLTPPTNDTSAIMAAALQGLERLYDTECSYKKGGVVLLGLRPEGALQLSFTSDPAVIDRRFNLMQAVDALNNRYHTRLVRHASEHINRSGWFSRRQLRSPAFTTSWRELPTIKA